MKTTLRVMITLGFNLVCMAQSQPYLPVPPSSYPALDGILNSKGTTQVGTTDPVTASATCNVPGMDLYVNKTNSQVYVCSAAGTPGTWNLVSYPFTPVLAPTRMIGGVPFFPADYWFNQPITNLPVNPQSDTMTTSIKTLAISHSQNYRLGPSPEFAINLVTNSTPGATIQFGESSTSMDAGTYRITGSQLASSYRFGTPSTLSSPACVFIPPSSGCDAHVLVLNTQGNPFLYELYQQQNTSSPWVFTSGTIWDLQGYQLRNATKIWWYGSDSDGASSADVSGAPIAPLILPHSELCGTGQISASTCVAPGVINHALRFALNQAVTDVGYTWPATHNASNPTGANKVLAGMRFRLKAGYDTTTCHNYDNNGLPFPSWMGPLFTQLSNYGLYLADYGSNGLISTDVDQKWGDPADSTSDNSVFSGWLHCIIITDFDIIDPTPQIINFSSGQVRIDWPPR